MLEQKVLSQQKLELPLRWVGPIKISQGELEFEGKVPLATFETPLWPSVARGAKVSCYAGGIETYVISSTMTRSIIVQAATWQEAKQLKEKITEQKEWLASLTKETSRYCRLQDLHAEIFGKQIWLRLSFESGNASGHNMTTKAASKIAQELTKRFCLEYVSDSGNFCVDKKVSGVNAILGRGCHVQAHLNISKKLCEKFFKCKPEELYRLCISKNWIGSHLAGSMHSANAHFANMLLAFYLATGQDGANIVEGSQGQSWVELQKEGLSFSCRLPHLIVGTVGNGKDLPQIQENLTQLGCHEQGSRERLAQIAAATVLCGELSLLAALVKPGVLIASHEMLERSPAQGI